jgi:FAD/FMN-containing dehydrogenase
MLKSRRYSQLMAIEQRCGLGRRLGWAARRESVIQDVQIPLPHASSFLHFMLQEVPILPIWICPARSPESRFLYPLYETDPSALYINFGFWGAVPGKQSDASYNRRIEDMVAKLDGKKSLYSSSYYSAEEFGQQYNQVVYQELKARYDPAGVLGTMYEKCVLGQ